MKKLLLTSAGFENPKVAEKFLELADKPAEKIKIIFVISAAVTEEEKYYVEKSKQELLNIGIIEQNIKILDLNNSISYTNFETRDYDVIYVCGGNTFYLLKKIRETGFDEIIQKFIENGKLYFGVSAGSILLGPNIEIASLGDKNKCGVKDFTGLNLTNTAISPHANTKEDMERITAFAEQVDYKVLPFTDNQALLVLDNKEEIIGD